MVNMWAKAAGEFYRKNKAKYASFSDVLKSPELKVYYKEKYGSKMKGSKKMKGKTLMGGESTGGNPTEAPPLGGAPVVPLGGAPELPPLLPDGTPEVATGGDAVMAPVVGGRKKKRTARKRSPAKKTEKRRAYMW